MPGNWSALDIDDDLELVDGLETFEFSRQFPGGGYAEAVECVGVREVAVGKHVAMFAEAVDQVFNIVAGLWSDGGVSRGDKLVDEDNVTWIVSQSRLAGIGDQVIVGATKGTTVTEA